MHYIKLGSNVKDSATGHKGIVTHYREEIGGSALYHFQPEGLDTKTGHPHEGTWIPPERVDALGSARIPDDLGKHRTVLNTQVTDTVSGFNGTATALTKHIDGCLHFEVQPAGHLPETGGRIKSHDFNVLRLEGPAIAKMTESQKDEVRTTNPSPAPMASHTPRLPA